MIIREITLQADHPTIPYVTHLRMRCNQEQLLVLWGYFYHGRFFRAQDELLSFEEHPELRDLNDGDGWNISEVNDFIAGSVSESRNQPPTTAHSTQ